MSRKPGEFLRPIPHDFMAKAPGMTTNRAAEEWQTGARVVKRWAQETGVQFRSLAGHMQPAPDDWAELCARYTASGLRKKNRWGLVIITRWTKETGIAPRVYVPAQKDEPKPKKRTPFEGRGMPVNGYVRTRLTSIWEDAAGILRADRWTVFRCNERGGSDAKGRYWLVGCVICTPDDLLARAERLRRRAA